MSTTYNDYRATLSQLKELPAQSAADLERAKERYARAGALADKAVSTADAAAAAALTAVDAHLRAARNVLEPLAKANLVPPHIRPSGGAMTATSDDMAQAEQCLAVAVTTLRQTVQFEIRRIATDNERLARESAERQRLAREAAARAAAADALRKKRLRLVLVGGLVLVALVAILLVVL